MAQVAPTDSIAVRGGRYLGKMMEKGLKNLDFHLLFVRYYFIMVKNGKGGDFCG